MKKMFITITLVLGLIFAGSVMATDCPICDNDINIKGTVGQETGVFLLKGQTETIKIEGEKTEVLSDGIMGYATENSSASFKGHSDTNYGPLLGAGGALSIGGSSLWGENTWNEAWVAGVTGSITAVGIYAEDASAKMKGSGEMSTAAIKSKEDGNRLAFASSNGSYGYNGTLNNSGVIIGGGITGGGSYVNNSVNGNVTNVSAVSGQITIVGAGGISMPSCGQ